MTGAIIQARMGSTRLPGKVLMDLSGKPMLERVVERGSRASILDKLIVATSTLPQDDPIAELAMLRGWLLFRGSENDVLDRYYKAARQHELDVVVRLTADNPMVDGGIIDAAVNRLVSDEAIDYAATGLIPNAFPLGLSVEVIRFRALEVAWREDRDPLTREHVTPFIYDHPGRFSISALSGDRFCEGIRWTVDTQADMDLMKRIFSSFSDGLFAWTDALDLMERNPLWRDINRDIVQRSV